MKALNEKAKKTIKIVTDVLFWVFFAFAVTFTVFAFTAQASPVGYPTIGNKVMLTVGSDSMTGKEGFKMGDLIITEVFPLEADEPEARQEKMESLVAGDVITFKAGDLDHDGYPDLNTHRIQSITVDRGHLVFTTHGDSNPAEMTEEVWDTDVLGKWTGKRVAGLGGFINFLQPPQVGFFIFIILPLGAFLGYEIYVLVVTVKKMKGKDKRMITAAEEELIKQKAVEEFLKKQEAEKKASEETSDK